MLPIARIAVDLALNREFDYLIPEALRGRVQAGMRVVVPFGAREVSGCVTALAAAPERPEVALKPIARIVGDRAYVPGPLLELARWMSDYYCAPLEHALRVVLPATVRRRGTAFRETEIVHPVPEAWPAGAALGALAKRAPKQAAVLDALRRAGALPLRDLTRAAAPAAVVRALAARGWVRIEAETARRDPLAGQIILRTEPLALEAQQATALAAVAEALDAAAPRVLLLYGVTGSGKTEVYLQAIARALAAGRGAIVLVPEIALTPQTIDRFRGRFGETVAVLHSRLTDGERHDEWHRLSDGRARIAVGPRSAVFAPLPRLGLIVVDEEHEPSYKQDESPRYHARDVAVMRGHIERCPVLLGTATPALESWRNAAAGKYRLLRMPQRVDAKRMPEMRVVDMRREAERTGRVSVFGQDLIDALRLRLDRAEQSILFLNRRGYATQVICPGCGYVAPCAHCSVPLVFHHDPGDLRCHICGAFHPVPSRCPQCGGEVLRYAGVGTQRVEAAVRKFFPSARVARMDADTTRGRDAHRTILNSFRAGQVDILVGTQMIAKGLDFPNVTLIGVLNADSALHLPDFRAGERTFQLLTQVAGRAGRGAAPGEVIVQSYTPFHPAVQAARRLDFEGFADQELAAREELGYPPYGRVVCVGVRGADEAAVRAAAEALAAALRPRLGRAVIADGPAPAPLARAKDVFRYQLLLRAPSAKAITGPLKEVWRAFRWPRGVSGSIDVDAVSVL